MLSGLIDTMRSCAACQLTTAHQRHPSTVPLVLDTRSTQTTTRLVDIIQTVSRILLNDYVFSLYGLYLHLKLMRARRINRYAVPNLLGTDGSYFFIQEKIEVSTGSFY